MGDQGGELLNQSGGLAGALVDLRAFAFTDELGVNTTIANDEYNLLPPDNTTQAQYLDFHLPTGNNMFYDLKNSWIQFDTHFQVSTNAPAWQDYAYGAAPPAYVTSFPAMMHYALRFLDLQFFLNNQLVNDQSPGYFPFKEFAKHCLNTPFNKVIDNCAYDYTFGWQENTFAMETGIVSPQGGRMLFSWGNYAGVMAGYIALRQSRMSVRFQPMDGFWQVDKFIPANVPIWIRLQNRQDNCVPAGANANWWQLYDENGFQNTAAAGQAQETIERITLYLRQIYPTNSAMNIYQKLLTKHMTTVYNVQHCETVPCQIQSGLTQFMISGLFTSRKPQTIFLHVVPTGNLNVSTKGCRVHPFANIGVTTGIVPIQDPMGAVPTYPLVASSPQLQSLQVNYAGRKYPRTWDYTRVTAPSTGTFLADYNEYVKQCRLNKDGPNLVNCQPFLTSDQYANGQLFVYVVTLQDSGETFQDRQCLESMKGALSLIIKFQTALTVNSTLFITAFTNSLVTIDTNNVVAKSF